jgi:hypothetical protein
MEQPILSARLRESHSTALADAIHGVFLFFLASHKIALNPNIKRTLTGIESAGTGAAGGGGEPGAKVACTESLPVMCDMVYI